MVPAWLVAKCDRPVAASALDEGSAAECGPLAFSPCIFFKLYILRQELGDHDGSATCELTHT